MKTKVKLRELNEYVEISITSKNKPDISKDIVAKWQRIIDLIAAVFDVPAGLIMKVTKKDMEVFLKSSNKDNPYPQHGKDHLGHGLYCETVLGTNQPLLIDNALKYHDWENNPDVKIDMISYYGLPIKWPDGTFFGTICVLDRQEKQYNDKHKSLLKQMKESMETDLKMLELQNKLYHMSMTDALTDVYNRRYLVEQLSKWLKDLKTQQNLFSVVMFDIDHFKRVNDEFGHLIGDKVLISIARIFKDALLDDDFIARFGGDEFVLCLKNKDKTTSKALVDDLITEITTNSHLKPYHIHLSYGIACIDKKETDIDQIIALIDGEMYKIKHHNLISKAE